VIDVDEAIHGFTPSSSFHQKTSPTPVAHKAHGVTPAIMPGSHSLTGLKAIGASNLAGGAGLVGAIDGGLIVGGSLAHMATFSGIKDFKTRRQDMRAAITATEQHMSGLLAGAEASPPKAAENDAQMLAAAQKLGRQKYALAQLKRSLPVNVSGMLAGDLMVLIGTLGLTGLGLTKAAGHTTPAALSTAAGSAALTPGAAAASMLFAFSESYKSFRAAAEFHKDKTVLTRQFENILSSLESIHAKGGGADGMKRYLEGQLRQLDDRGLYYKIYTSMTAGLGSTFAG
jgi:hypothetical protein